MIRTIAMLIFAVMSCTLSAKDDCILSSVDLSSVLTLHQDMRYGYIGDNYQRLRVYFTDIVKMSDMKYKIAGKSKVKNNICSFDGELNIMSIDTCQHSKANKNNHICTYYMIKAKYVFKEYGKHGTGAFKGILVSKIIFKNRVAHYDETGLEDNDSFCNNQFSGTWTSDATGIIKKSCWGDYRIPNSGDLDTGAAEFIPNSKYWKYGWQDYIDAYMSGTTDGWRKENKEWWK